MQLWAEVAGGLERHTAGVGKAVLSSDTQTHRLRNSEEFDHAGQNRTIGSSLETLLSFKTLVRTVSYPKRHVVRK